MNSLTSLRVLIGALALTTLSFTAGIAGDLAQGDSRSGASVVVRIPPELPPDTPRAGPLPRTATAEARPVPSAAAARDLTAQSEDVDPARDIEAAKRAAISKSL